MNAVDVGVSASAWIHRASLDFGLPEERARVITVTGVVPQGSHPNWVMRYLPSREIVFSRFVRHDITRLRFELVSKSASQCERMVSFIQQRLMNNYYKIPGILEDFSYPAPNRLRGVSGGSLAAGAYFVGVTGLSPVDDSETSLSEVVEVTVGANESIELWIPRYPEGPNWFTRYNLYLGTTADNMLRTDNSPVSASSWSQTRAIIESLPSGSVQPPQQSTVAFEIIEVDDFGYMITDDRREPETVILAMTMEIKSRRYLQRDQSIPIEEVIHNVEVLEGGE